MIEVISSDNAASYRAELRSMFELRHHIFIETLGWPLPCEESIEKDQFDTDDAIYLILCNEERHVIAATRLLPTTGAYLLASVFPYLIEDVPPVSSRVWEASRLVVDHRRDRLRSCRNAAGKLLCGIMEYAIQAEMTELVSVSDTRIERLLTKLGWDLQRLGEAHEIDGYAVAAEITPVSREALAKIRLRTGVTGTVLRTETGTIRRAA